VITLQTLQTLQTNAVQAAVLQPQRTAVNRGLNGISRK